MYAQAQHRKRRRRQLEGLVRIPSHKLEYAYYVAVIYTVMGPAVGLEIPLVAGLMIVVISAACIRQLRSCAKIVYGPIALLLACAASFFLVQILIHGESILDSTLRGYILWILTLIIVKSLCLRRGFSRRFPLVLFAIGVATVPFVGFNQEAVDQARIDIAVQGGLTHPGGLAEWFGCLTIYFAIIGLESRRSFVQLGAWLIGVGCLFIVMLTVERGPLLATALAITVGLRGLLRRGFVPLLALIILAGVFSLSGLFEKAVSSYTQRGLEETGREVLWPMAVDRFLTSPLGGVGESNILLRPPMSSKASPPHNAFLHVALSSGVVPFAFFLAFWIQAARRTVHAKGQDGDSFRLPYLVFTFVTNMTGDTEFMSIWGLFALSLAAGSAVVYGKQRLHVARVGNKIRSGLFPNSRRRVLARSQS